MGYRAAGTERQHQPTGAGRWAGGGGAVTLRMEEDEREKVPGRRIWPPSFAKNPRHAEAA